MHILLLGSTGRTGTHLLNQALKRGHTVHVLVRDKSKLSASHPNLVIFEGSPLDKPALENAMQGCEAVLSTLNVSRKSDFPWAGLRSPENLLSSAMKNIIELATKHHIQRVIFMSAWGVGETKKDIPGWFRWMIDHSKLRFPYADHERQELLVKQTSLEWTSVRAAGLTNSDRMKKVIVSFNNDPKPNWTISRSSVANFMLDTLEKNLYVRQMPVISGP